MKNVSKFIGIIAFVAVIGFSFAACNKGGGSSSSGDSGGSGRSSGGGKLTVTGLPSGDWGVQVFAPGTGLSTVGAITQATLNASSRNGDGFEAFNDELSGNVFSLLNWGHQPWTKSGSFPVLLINSDAYWLATVNFSNGSATVPFSGFTAVTSY